jgi:hypothetical protein
MWILIEMSDRWLQVCSVLDDTPVNNFANGSPPTAAFPLDRLSGAIIEDGDE